MKLNYEYRKIASLFSSSSDSVAIINSIAYDTRKISRGENVLFFALKGGFRDGHSFIDEAYTKGVRHFVVINKGSVHHLSGAQEIVVEDSFDALQKLAHYHRSQFNYPVVAITGSYGKTTVKEWLSEILSISFSVIRSPKSYNSRLGVSLSLLEMTKQTEIAIIETGISNPEDMAQLEAMIKPTHGIYTSLGSAHLENFKSLDELKREKIILFSEAQTFIHPSSLQFDVLNAKSIDENAFDELKSVFKINNPIQWQNCQLAIAMAIELGVSIDVMRPIIASMESLSMRLESFDGINNNVIINDAYNLDQDSLRHALEYQLITAADKPRVVVIGLTENEKSSRAWVTELVESFSPDQFIIHMNGEKFEHDISGSAILIKGSRGAKMELIAGQFKRQKHQTFLQVDFAAIRKNIGAYKSQLDSTTKLLCMVKASSYGSDATKMGLFLEQLGVNYLGVAYPDEGVELRDQGVTLPILVMNCEEAAFPTCISHKLEPAIFSIWQLELFVQALILHAKSSYPIHLKVETGMNRLGFEASDIEGLIQKINAQPEVTVASIYSHLSEADVKDSEHVQFQADRFVSITDRIQAAISYPIPRHILNSEGIINYPDAQFEMVRLGIGMYGISSNKSWQSQLAPAIEWISAISQIKHLAVGDSVSYGRTFIAEKPMEIAVIPVGYADGFNRLLGNGVGGVYINEDYCPTVGTVCMDMIMVDVTGLSVKEKDRVEIIGIQQTIHDFAAKLGTIPYEVMTHFSERMHRIFIE